VGRLLPNVSPTLERGWIVGTAPRGGTDIMHLEKPTLSKPCKIRPSRIKTVRPSRPRAAERMQRVPLNYGEKFEYSHACTRRTPPRKFTTFGRRRRVMRTRGGLR
jgi:hypothetical protein